MYLFNIVQFFKDFNFEFIRVALEFFILTALYTDNFEFFKALILCLEYVIVEVEFVFWCPSGFWWFFSIIKSISYFFIFVID